MPELVQHVLQNPKMYPGPHNTSQDRTSRGLQKLDVNRQLNLIFDAFCTRLREMLLNGQNVSIQNFGAFTTEAQWYVSDFGPDKVGKRPCFLPSNEMKNANRSWKEKKETIVDENAISAAQSVSGKVAFLNEVPVASGAYYKADVVRSGIRQLFVAVLDLMHRGYDLDLDMSVCRFRAGPGKISVTFDPEYVRSVRQPKTPYTENKESLSEGWSKASFSKSMATFIQRPNSPEVQATRIASSNLAVMSRDLTGVQY